MRLLQRSFQFEDLLLLLWLALAEPMLRRWLEAATGGGDVMRLPGQSLSVGLLLLAAVGCALAAILTRSPDEAPADLESMSPALYARFPLMAALGIVGFEAMQQLGWSNDDYLFLVIVAATAASAMLYRRLPAMRRLYRRLLMTPIILLGTTTFAALAQTLLGGMDANQFIAGLRSPENLLILLLMALLVQYLMFVFAPRQVADGSGSVWHWAVRFVLYVAALLLGQLWLARWLD
jgi:hypothetical protein